jgi:hypothetical protein
MEFKLPRHIPAIIRKASIPPIVIASFKWTSNASTIDFIYEKGRCVLKAVWSFLHNHDRVYFAVGMAWLTVIALFDDLKRAVSHSGERHMKSSSRTYRMSH